MARVQAAPQAAGDDDDDEITPEFLRRWAQLRWESILHYMVGSGGVMRVYALVPAFSINFLYLATHAGCNC